MSLPIQNLPSGAVIQWDESPLFNLLTRVLVKSLCPVLQSEIIFGGLERPDAEEKFAFWIGEELEGDVNGQVGIGADKHVLRSLAIHLGKKNGEVPHIEGALIELRHSVAAGLRQLFRDEELQITLRSRDLVLNYIAHPVGDFFFVCPVETKFGILRMTFGLSTKSGDLLESLGSLHLPRESRKIRVYSSQLDMFHSQVNRLAELEGKLLTGPHIRTEMRAQIKRLKRTVQHLKSEPVETLFAPARKLVNDIAKSQGKQVQFTSYGTWLLLGKTVLNHLYEPVLHLIRNAVDHGIEEPRERERLNKAATGHIKCIAAFGPSNLKIIISDDGRGLDLAKIRACAITKGLLSSDEANRRTAERLSHLIFEPGFSTRDRADSISGRGLGLDIVKKGIEAVGGNIRLLSSSPHGTSFEICVPVGIDGEAGLAPPPMSAFEKDEERDLLLDELAGFFERLSGSLKAFSASPAPAPAAAYEAYRLAHSIKGTAGFLGWHQVAAFCHTFEDLLNLVAEQKVPAEATLKNLITEAGERLEALCEASKRGESFSVIEVRKLEASMLQLIWSATKSDDRTHLFFGKYHVGAVEKLLSRGGQWKVEPESDFNRATLLPYGALVQFTGDRQGYAGVLVSEDSFAKLIQPVVSGTSSNTPLKRQLTALGEFASLMGNQISELANATGITLQPSAPLTFFGWGQPLRILGNPTYVYRATRDEHSLYLVGDFHLPQETRGIPAVERQAIEPTLLMRETMTQCERQFARWALDLKFVEVTSQSSVVGFDNGITSILSCTDPQKTGLQYVYFLSYEPPLAKYVQTQIAGHMGQDFPEQVDLYDCLNETSNIIGGLVLSELEKRGMKLTLSLPTVFLGKAFVANFNRLFVTNKWVGNTPHGKLELRLLVAAAGV